MKLNRQALRKIILNEIKMLNENIQPAAVKGKLVVGDAEFQLSKGVMNLRLTSLKMRDEDGSADVVIKAAFGVTRKGNVSAEKVKQIVNDAQNKNEFTIQTDDGTITATKV